MVAGRGTNRATNLARLWREATLLEHPKARVLSRSRCGLTHDTGGGKRLGRIATGPVHTVDLEEIDTVLGNDSDGWLAKSNPATLDFLYRVDAEGRRRVTPRRGHPDQWIEFGRPHTAGRPIPLPGVSIEGAEVRQATPDLTVGQQINGYGVKVDVTLNHPRVPRAYGWPVILNNLTLDKRSLVAPDGTVVGFLPPGVIYDSAGRVEKVRERRVERDGRLWVVYTIPDISDWVFPVTLDPTISVAATGDTGGVNTNASSFTTGTFLIGKGGGGAALNGFWRFLGFDPAQGDTIDTATVTMQSGTSQSGTTCTVRLTCVDEDDAAVPTNYTTFMADPLTTAYTDWTLGSWTAGNNYESNDLASAVKEVVDRPGYAAENALIVRADDQGSTAGAYRYVRTYAAAPAVLTYSYTPGSEEHSGSGATSATTGATSSGKKAGSGYGSATAPVAATASGAKATEVAAATEAAVAVTATGEGAKAGAGTSTAEASTAATGTPARQGAGTATAAATPTADGTKSTGGDASVEAATGIAATGSGGLTDDATITATTTVAASGEKGGEATATLTAAILVWASGTRQIYMDVRPPIDHFETGRLPLPPDFPPLPAPSPAKLPEPVEKHLTVTTDDGPRQFVVPDTR